MMLYAAVMMKDRTRKKSRVSTPKAETVGRRVARLRNACGLTQVELAKRIGSGQNRVSDYERGRTRVPPDVLAQMAKVFNVTTDAIVGLRAGTAKSTAISLQVLRRAGRIDALPPATKKHVIRTIDMLLKAADS